MARRGDYLKAAAALISAIGEDRSALAGGLAVWAHGYVRGTRDVDVIVAVSLEEARGLLAARGIRAVLRRGDSVSVRRQLFEPHDLYVPAPDLPQMGGRERHRKPRSDIHPEQLQPSHSGRNRAWR